jgi:hypothetical protein
VLILISGPTTGRRWFAGFRSVRHVANNSKSVPGSAHGRDGFNGIFIPQGRTTDGSRELAKNLRNGHLGSNRPNLDPDFAHLMLSSVRTSMQCSADFSGASTGGTAVRTCRPARSPAAGNQVGRRGRSPSVDRARHRRARCCHGLRGSPRRRSRMATAPRRPAAPYSSRPQRPRRPLHSRDRGCRPTRFDLSGHRPSEKTARLAEHCQFSRDPPSGASASVSRNESDAGLAFHAWIELRPSPVRGDHRRMRTPGSPRIAPRSNFTKT